MMAGIQETTDPITERALARDAALHRVSLTRRWILAAAAALTAGLAALASALLPGKSLGAKSHATATPASASTSPGTPPLPAPANPAQLGIQAPGEAPQAAPAPQPTPQPQASPPQPAPSGGGGGAVVSGGS